jgi:uncharacterized membrane protein
VLMVKPTRWLEIILLYTALTTAIVYLVPGDSILFPIRYGFGFVFVLFMPGYCLVNILFLGKDRLDPVEMLVLSVALSFGITGLVLLFFGLSPIGINFISTTVSTIVLVLVLAVVAFMRKSREGEATQQ